MTKYKASDVLKNVVYGAVVLSMLGCGRDDGRVIEKIHEPEQIVSVWRYDGSEIVREPGKEYCQHNYRQVPFVDDEDFKVVVKRGEECSTVHVDEEQYQQLNVGDTFRGHKIDDDENHIPENDVPVLRPGEAVEMKFHNASKQDQN